jgi:serine/tyrosine/threonine adenylyltransferase
METHKLDFHVTFRTLSSFKPSVVLNAQNKGKPTATNLEPELDVFISRLLTATPESERLDTDAAKLQWAEFLQTYAERIQSEHGASELGWPEALSEFEEQRQKDMKAANPRFILRQWLLEEVIKAVERDHDAGKRVLAKVLQVSKGGTVSRVSQLTDTSNPDGLQPLRTMGR